MHVVEVYSRSPICWDPSGDGLELNDDWHLCVLRRVGGGDDKVTGRPRYFLGLGYTRDRALQHALSNARRYLKDERLELRDTERP